MVTEVQLHHCKECNRYKTPKWVHLEPESPKLLGFCLKSVKGLNKGGLGGKLKLVDAAFIYTEPHSRRLHVKVIIQKEVMNGTILQKD
jgi:nonsense-mediated mRNA decay protein 3